MFRSPVVSLLVFPLPLPPPRRALGSQEAPGIPIPEPLSMSGGPSWSVLGPSWGLLGGLGRLLGRPWGLLGCLGGLFGRLGRLLGRLGGLLGCLGGHFGADLGSIWGPGTAGSRPPTLKNLRKMQVSSQEVHFAASEDHFPASETNFSAIPASFHRSPGGSRGLAAGALAP